MSETTVSSIPTSRTAPEQIPFADLATDLTGRMLLPTDADYPAVATPWNVAVATAPVAVVEALDAANVASAVRFAGRHGLEVAVQATGHGAWPQTRPTLLVSTALMDEVVVDPHGSARVGAGVRWQQVLDAAAPHGLAGLAGSSPHVGVVGYLTGGGLGPVARTYGLASDHVTAFDVVTGDGEIRRATATENPALFWALRGGKGALGIVTSVEFDLVPLAEILGGCLFFDGADAGAVLAAWRDWSDNLPEQASTSLAIMRLPAMPSVPPPLAGTTTVAVRFAWTGNADEGRAVIAPMEQVAPVILGGLGVMPYAALGSIHNDPVDPMPVAERATLLDELPAEAVDALLRVAGPGSDCPQVIVELRRLGGAIARAPQVAGALCHRDAAYSLLTIGLDVPPLKAATEGNAEQILAAMAPYGRDVSLPNFGATSDPARIARNYDSATLARLGTLSATYDPKGVLAVGRLVRAACALGH